MKKTSLLLTALVLATAGYSQRAKLEIEGIKDYSTYLPAKGDFAIGFDMGQTIKYIGNSFSEKKEGESAAAFAGDIFMKYYLSPNLALRGTLGIAVDNQTQKMPLEAVLGAREDVRKYRSGGFDFGFGLEYRKSVNRFQVYGGGELFMGFNSAKTDFLYGDPQGVGIYPFGDNVGEGFYITKHFPQNRFDIGLALLGGADYFIAKKISIGIELQLRGYFSNQNARLSEYVREDTGRFEKDFTAPKTSGFKVAPRGYLTLMFHF